LKNIQEWGLQLSVGIPGINGPGKSVTEITPLALNLDRIQYMRKKAGIIKKGKQTVEANLEKFSTFEQCHPDVLQDY
jgi:hypothetical protein